MTLFAYINQNLERIRHDMRIGLISPGVLRYYQIYSRYDYYKRLGHRNHDAVFCTAEDFALGESWVLKIIKKMEVEL